MDKYNLKDIIKLLRAIFSQEISDAHSLKRLSNNNNKKVGLLSRTVAARCLNVFQARHGELPRRHIKQVLKVLRKVEPFFAAQESDQVSFELKSAYSTLQKRLCR